MENYVYEGWLLKYDVPRYNGMIFKKDALKFNEEEKIPIVIGDKGFDSMNIIGYATLVKLEEGIYAYCFLNDTEQGRLVKSLIERGENIKYLLNVSHLHIKGQNVIDGRTSFISLGVH